MVSAAQVKALQFIIQVLDQERLQYHITGGMAGNIYGSQWPLHDIDIEVSLRDLYVLEQKCSVSSPKIDVRELDFFSLQL